MCLHGCDAVEIAGLLELCSAGIHREAVAIKKMCPDALVESTQALTGHIEAETLRRLGENIEERANEAMDDDVASSVDLIEPLWADVQRIEAEINATDGDPDEALEKRFSQAEEHLWVRSCHAFNAQVGRLAPVSALRLHAETPLTDPKRTGVPDGSGSLIAIQ